MPSVILELRYKVSLSFQEKFFAADVEGGSDYAKIFE
jgi:hypothetical protein